MMRWGRQVGWAVRLVLLGLGCGRAGDAQVVEVSGGSSTLYQSQGATLKLHGSGFESGLSGGMSDGHFIAGSYFRRVTPRSTYTLGMQEYDFSLPTDLFSGEHRLNVVGAGLKTQVGSSRVQGFVGASSTRLDSPFVQGFSHLTGAAALLMKTALSPRLNLSTQLFDAKTLTLIESVEWTRRKNTVFAASLGFAGDQHYAAVSMDVRRPRHDLQAEYISTGPDFRRTGDQGIQSPEFVRENIAYTYRSSTAPRFTFTVMRQNFLIPGSVEQPPDDGLGPSVDFPPPDPIVVASSISGLNQASAVEQAGRVHLSQSVFHSSYEGESNLAFAVSASMALGRRVEVQSSYFRSYLLGRGVAPVSSLVTTVRERLNSRVSVSETINDSGGQPSVGFGGSLLSGFGTVSVDYQTVYVATRPENPFQQSLMLDVGLSVFGRMLLHVGTLVSPTGKLLYTADARAAQGFSRAPAETVTRSKMGESVLSARVVDEGGNPVEGAAVEIDGTMYFTDSGGGFFLREKRPALHGFRVAVGEFLDGRTYRVVSAPMRLASSKQAQEPSILVVAVAGP